MFALIQVEGKGTAQKIETDLQAYVKRLKYEGFTNTLKAAGNGVHEAMNTIYLVFWMKDEETPPVAPDAPTRMRWRLALVQSTLVGFCDGCSLGAVACYAVVVLFGGWL